MRVKVSWVSSEPLTERIVDGFSIEIQSIGLVDPSDPSPIQRQSSIQIQLLFKFGKLKVSQFIEPLNNEVFMCGVDCIYINKKWLFLVIRNLQSTEVTANDPPCPQVGVQKKGGGEPCPEELGLLIACLEQVEILGCGHFVVKEMDESSHRLEAKLVNHKQMTEGILCHHLVVYVVQPCSTKVLFCRLRQIAILPYIILNPMRLLIGRKRDHPMLNNGGDDPLIVGRLSENWNKVALGYGKHLFGLFGLYGQGFEIILDYIPIPIGQDKEVRTIHL